MCKSFWVVKRTWALAVSEVGAMEGSEPGLSIHRLLWPLCWAGRGGGRLWGLRVEAGCSGGDD